MYIGRVLISLDLLENAAEEALQAGALGIVEERGGRVLFDKLALIHEQAAAAHFTGKAHTWVTTTMVMS